MRKVIKNVIITCDICGKKIDAEKLAICDELVPTAITKIDFEIYYGGVRQIRDLCVSCNKEIVNLLRNLSPNNQVVSLGIKER